MAKRKDDVVRFLEDNRRSFYSVWAISLQSYRMLTGQMPVKIWTKGHEEYVC